MDILDDVGVSKLSANVFSKVNYSLKVLRNVFFVNKKKIQCNKEINNKIRNF